MYALWFKKPMDIQDPTVLSREETERLKAIPPDLSLWTPNFSTNPSTNFSKRAANLGIFPSIRNQWKSLVVLGMLLVVCAAYGGAHLSTWNFDFPTPMEQKLWRIACISTVAGSFLNPVFWLLCELVLERGGFIRFRKFIFEDILDTGDLLVWFVTLVAVFSVFAALFSPLLLAARFFLVVESFISLRDVPSGVYATVPWAQYIPHI
jgi:hypothetical protein